MKIKITLIAFFASALLLTSCMKNEVSPGIESVRTAYAAFLNAKAQAEVIKANADAALQMALAKVEEANATYRLAQAAGVDATTAQALEALAQAIEMNKIALDAAKRADKVLEDAYQLAVQTAKNTAVALYFGNYKTAITGVNDIQALIYDKQREIVMLNLDLVNGTDSALTAAKANLAAKQAALVTYQANYDAAVASLGNVAAAKAKVVQLQQDSSTLENEVKTFTVEMTTQKRLHDSTTWNAKKALEATAKANWEAAVIAARPDTALARFLRDTMLYDSIPQFWGKALADLATAQTNLATKATDTLNSGIAYRDALAVIALGTSDLDAIIATKIDSMGKYRDTLIAYLADTVAKNTARLARIADTVQVRTDTATWNAEIAVLHDTIQARRIGGYGDTIVPKADSAYRAAQVDYAVAVRIPDTRAAWQLAVTAQTNSVSAWTTNAGIKSPFASSTTALEGKWNAGTMGIFREGIRARLTTTQGLLSGRQAAIAAATANLPDLRSDYLYHQTFIPSLQAAVTAALAAKEAARPAYETWRDAYFATHLATKEAAVITTKGLYDDAKDVTVVAKASFDAQASVIEYKRLDALNKTATANLASVKVLIPLWKAVTTGQSDYLQGFATAVTNAEGLVTGAENAVKVAEWTYANGLVNYDKFTADLAELNARLLAAQAQVTYWKALLDEALAN